MKLAVCVKRVLDPEARVRLTAKGNIDPGTAAMVVDPVDMASLELAVQIVEARGGSVTALTVADDEDAEGALRAALAQGASRAIQVAGADFSRLRGTASGLAEAMRSLGPFDLVVAGWASSDHGTGGMAAMLAHSLDLPLVQGVAAVDELTDNAVIAQRRRDGGHREIVRVRLPAILSVYPGAVQPRFPTTQARLRARRMVVERFEVGQPASRESAEPAGWTFRRPPPRMAGILVPGPEMNARERLRFLVAAGQQRVNTSRVVKGPPDEAAAVLAAFVRERGLVVS